jgi:hypothetical protein
LESGLDRLESCLGDWRVVGQLHSAFHLLRFTLAEEKTSAIIRSTLFSPEIIVVAIGVPNSDSELEMGHQADGK